MSETGNAEILDELRRITKLLALLATKGESQKEQIRARANSGFAPKEIADLVGTTPNTVSVTLYAMKKKGKVGSTRAKASK